MVWWVWSAALLILLYKYYIGPKWFGGTSSFVISTTAFILYIVAIVAASAIGPKLDSMFAKMFNKAEIQEMESNIRGTFKKSAIFHDASKDAADELNKYSKKPKK